MNLLFPVGRCMGCDRPRPVKSSGLCEMCEKRIALYRIPPESCERCSSHIPRGRACPFCSGGFAEGLDFLYSPLRYRAEVRRLVHLLKFGHEKLAAEYLGPLMANALKDRSFDCIVPVPLFRTRRRERGYNQSTLLAEAVYRETGIPVREELLLRVKETKAQSGLARELRGANVENAFQAADGVKGLSILLLDDVRTSGSTARACAAALREKGAARVSLLTAASVWCFAENEKKPVKKHAVKMESVPEPDSEDMEDAQDGQ